MTRRQDLRVKFMELVDEVETLSKDDQQHLLWWFAKESLYHLGVVNQDITQVTLPNSILMQHVPSCPILADTTHDCEFGIECTHPCICETSE